MCINLSVGILKRQPVRAVRGVGVSGAWVIAAILGHTPLMDDTCSGFGITLLFLLTASFQINAES